MKFACIYQGRQYMRRHKPIGARQQDVWALFGTRHCEWQVDKYGRYFHSIMSLLDFTIG
jgi:hypothetical protein